MSKMEFQELVLSSIENLFHGNTLISISGKAGTGKTSLSLYLIGKFLTSTQPYESSCVWVQASEPFPKKRLETLFNKNQKQLAYLTQNIFIIPNHGPFTTYQQQLEKLGNFPKKDFVLPPGVKFIVIDNISHHLRFQFSLLSDIKERSHLVNIFYETILNPLIFRCQREKINLILLHEVSYNVESQKTRPFFSKLYERLKGLHISLTNLFLSDKRTMELTVNNSHKSLNFDIINSGFKFVQ